MAKTVEQLGGILRRMYDDAPDRHKVANIHLFGVKYADDIRDSGLNARQVVQAAGINKSYVVEVNKGMVLSHYVIAKPQFRD